MAQSIMTRVGTLLLMLVLVFGTSLFPAFAHDGESHATEADETAHKEETAEIKRLETLVGLLKQLVTLMNALKIQQGYAPVVTVPKAVVADVHHDEGEMDTHHEEHSAEATSTVAVKQLVIEIEPHNDKTHVHVRYVDKPEAMFFVTSDIHNTDGIVNEVNAKTGLSKDDIKKALKFME